MPESQHPQLCADCLKLVERAGQLRNAGLFKQLDVVAELIALKIQRQAIDLAVCDADAFLGELCHIRHPRLITQILKLTLPEFKLCIALIVEDVRCFAACELGLKQRIVVRRVHRFHNQIDFRMQLHVFFRKRGQLICNLNLELEDLHSLFLAACSRVCRFCRFCRGLLRLRVRRWCICSRVCLLFGCAACKDSRNQQQRESKCKNLFHFGFLLFSFLLFRIRGFNS